MDYVSKRYGGRLKMRRECRNGTHRTKMALKVPRVKIIAYLLNIIRLSQPISASIARGQPGSARRVFFQLL